MKFTKKFSEVKRELKEKAFLLAGGNVIPAFNELITELERIVFEKENYYNSAFWRKPLKVKFDCEADKTNMKRFALERRKNKKISDSDLDYILGLGVFKDYDGLLFYVKKCRDTKLDLLSAGLNLNKKVVLDKATEEMAKGKVLLEREGKTVHSKGFKKYAKKVKEQLKKAKVI